MMLKALLPMVLIASSASESCEEADRKIYTQQDAVKESAAQDAVRELHYYRDVKSGLCFAASTRALVHAGSYVLTYVPCKDVPSNLLKDVQ